MEERKAIFELVLPRIRAIRKHVAAGTSGSAGSESIKIIEQEVGMLLFYALLSLLPLTFDCRVIRNTLFDSTLKIEFAKKRAYS